MATNPPMMAGPSEPTEEPAEEPAGEPATDPPAAPEMADDFVVMNEPEVSEEAEEVTEGDAAGLGRLNMDQFWFPVGKNEDAGTPVYVAPVSRLEGELLADGDIQLSWDVNAAHAGGYTFEFQIIEGNYESTTEYASLAGVVMGYNSDNTKATATFTPGALKTVYRIRVVALDASDNASDGQTINVQSATNEVDHQPGTIYTGNSGFAGQILLPTDFTHASYVKTD